ncbi:MAG: aminotransferase class I/II-fold pyridoxal phosphate-dependent enzyme [Opitutales bacterium]
MAASGRLNKRLAAERERREKAGLWREVPIRNEPLGPRELCSNDYLRLSQHPRVAEAAATAARDWGASASASPLLGGHTRLHQQLLERLASWQGYAHGMLWTSGYAANQAVLGHLPAKGDLVLADRLIHASMISGLLSSGARLRRYHHLDLAHLEAYLQENRNREGACFVVTETVFSMDGDYPDLAALAALRERYGFVWVVDEAHATGWYGHENAGLMTHTGLAGQADVLVGTLGKGLGAGGAYALFRDPSLRDYLVNVAGEFIYSTFLSPAVVGAALAAVELATEMAEESARLRQISNQWRSALQHAGLKVPAGDSPVLPLILKEEATTLRTREALASRGWHVAAVRPPTVPAGTARLRLSLHRGLNEDHLAEFCSNLLEALSERENAAIGSA